MQKEFDLETLSLYSFEKNNFLDQVFLAELKSVKAMESKIGSFYEKLTKFTIKNQFWDRAFIIGVDDLPLGYTYMYRHSFSTRIATLNYAIVPSFQGMGYGKLFLKEISDYVFLNHQLVDLISLIVNQENEKSIKSALKAGFIKEDIFYIKERSI